MWRRDLLYHSSVSVQDTFRVSVMMDTFNVFHYEEVDAYDRCVYVGGESLVSFWRMTW